MPLPLLSTMAIRAGTTTPSGLRPVEREAPASGLHERTMASAAASGQKRLAEPAASGQQKEVRAAVAEPEPAASGQAKRADVAEQAASGHKKRRRSLTRQDTVDIDEVGAMSEACRMKQIPASCFGDDTLLGTLCIEHGDNFKKLIPETDHGRSSVGELTWGSMCSGSEGAHFVMRELKDHFGWNLRQVFACESNANKRKWIDNLVNATPRSLGEPLMCIFCDIKNMGEAMSYCHVHGKPCTVPHCDILIVSTSCKDLSNLSNHKNTEPVLGKPTSPGGSADTFNGMLAYLDQKKIELLIYENSDNLDDTKEADIETAAGQISTNNALFLSALSSRYIECQNFTLNSCLFGVPQNRKRFWCVGVQTVTSRIFDFGNRDLSDMFQTLRSLVGVCQRLPPSVTNVLLDDSHPSVCTELARRQSANHTEKALTWITEHTKITERLLLSTCCQDPPCPATNQSPWLKTLTRKQQSTLMIHQTIMINGTVATPQPKRGDPPARKHRAAKKDEISPSQTLLSFAHSGKSQQGTVAASGQLKQGSAASDQTAGLRFMIDVMPSPGRLIQSTRDTRRDDVILSPCILPTQLLWLHREGNSQRLLIGREAMLLQGWPIGQVDCVSDTFSESFLQDLAGNCTSPPVLLAVLLATFYAVSWKSQERDSDRPAASHAEVDAALALFEGLLK